MELPRFPVSDPGVRFATQCVANFQFRTQRVRNCQTAGILRKTGFPTHCVGNCRVVRNPTRCVGFFSRHQMWINKVELTKPLQVVHRVTATKIRLQSARQITQPLFAITRPFFAPLLFLHNLPANQPVGDDVVGVKPEDGSFCSISELVAPACRAEVPPCGTDPALSPKSAPSARVGS